MIRLVLDLETPTNRGRRQAMLQCDPNAVTQKLYVVLTPAVQDEDPPTNDFRQRSSLRKVVMFEIALVLAMLWALIAL